MNELGKALRNFRQLLVGNRMYLTGNSNQLFSMRMKTVDWVQYAIESAVRKTHETRR